MNELDLKSLGINHEIVEDIYFLNSVYNIDLEPLLIRWKSIYCFTENEIREIRYFFPFAKNIQNYSEFENQLIYALNQNKETIYYTVWNINKKIYKVLSNFLRKLYIAFLNI